MLRIRLLGELAADDDGRPIAPPASRRAWALLGYLALHPGAHPRASVAAAFWPDVLDSSARASMRSALWALRRSLGPVADEVLDTSRDRLGLQGAVWVDASAFDAALRAGRREQAVALCRGELLGGFEDEWVLQARDVHRTRLLDALLGLADDAAAAGDHAAAVDWARRAAAVDPFAEDAVRVLMQRLAGAGDRAAALTAYGRLQERLARELRTTPSEPTRALAQALRGAAAPAGAAAPGPAAPAPAGPRRPLLVGRDREHATLTQAWSAARRGGGAAALITGEAGLGKSRLTAELAPLARADGGIVATAAAPDVGDAPPFGLWAELLGELLHATGPPPADSGWVAALAPLHPRLGVPSPPQATPELARARLLEAAADALGWAAAQAPLLLVVEDLHAADPSSVGVLAHVTRRLGNLPVLLVITRRPRPARGDVAALEQGLRSRALLGSELALEPLPADAVARLARHAGIVDEQAVRAIVAAADGNPLLATEAARALARGERSLPAGLRATVRAAAASLSPAARRLLDLVAVAGEALATADAAALLDDRHALAAALAAAHDTGLLDPDARDPRFRHALLREAVYAELAPSVRSDLHLALAARLDDAADHARAGEVARHLRLAGRTADAVAQLRRAAAHARRVGALEEAAALMEQATALVPADPELALERADIAAWRHHGEEAVAAFGPALAALEARGDPLAVARAHVRFADWHHVPMCAPRVANAAYRRALAVLDAHGLGDGGERREVLAALAWTEAIAGDLTAAEAMIAELDALSDHGDALRFLCDRARSLALIRRGRFTESYAPGCAAAETAVRVGRADLAYSCWTNVAGAAVCAGELGVALEVLDRALREVRGGGLLAIETELLQARAWVLGCAGAPAEAEELLRSARRLADRLGAADLAAGVDFDRARLALQGGDHAGAADLFAAALVRSGQFSRPLARIWRAEALARLGRGAEANAELRAATAERVTPGDWPDTLVARLARVQGLIAAGRGEHALAARRLREAADGWRRRTRVPAAGAEAGERWAAALTDLGRPVVGTVVPQDELDAVLEDLARLPSVPVPAATLALEVP